MQALRRATCPAGRCGRATGTYVGDFTGDGREDLWVFNGSNWSIPYLGHAALDRHGARDVASATTGSCPGWQMRPDDRHYVGDFNGDGKADLYVFNGTNWSIAYLGMLQLDRHRALDEPALRRQRARLADAGARPALDRGHQRRRQGRPLRLQPPGLGAGVPRDDDLERHRPRRRPGSEDWVGEWNLGSVDRFEPCDYEGVGGRRDLIVHNTDWLGMIRATPSLSLQRIYYKWIHNYRYGRNW